jgi:DNA-binding transcriptional MocR family regulator
MTMPAPHRIVVEDDVYGRLEVTREPAPELTRWAGTGPDRGVWEDDHPARGDVEYLPPLHAGPTS